MRRNFRLIVFVLFAAAGCGAAAAQQPDATFDRQVSVDALVEVEVSTGSGRIEVRPGGAGAVRVRGELHVDRRGGFFAFFRGGSRLSDDEIEELKRSFESDPPVELRGQRLVVGEMDQDRDWGRGISISYEIEVPAPTNVVARAGSGRVAVEGIDGDVRAQAGSGSIRVVDVGGRVTARAGSGRIIATGAAGDFEAHAGSGSIEARLTGSGDVTVSTGSGSIDIGGVDGALSARTGSGSLTVTGSPAGDWDLSTGSGGMRLVLPDDAAFDLDARAGSGGVSTDHPITIRGSVDRSRLSGQVRGGGPLITARTGSGGIRIE